ncbi:MAG: DUF1015 domain-containing protein [Armatimonadetes bacterium]|nr:DUF1015 domain-containing protein [Armatimonadota bacterium]
MAEVHPFRGLRYRFEIAGAPAEVLAPPYDVISDEDRQRLLARSEYNIARLTLGEQSVDLPADERDYTASAALLEEWRTRGVQAYDRRPAVYVYEQTYQAPPPRNDLIKRRGIIVAVKLEPLGQGSILPHEGTLSEPKRDRLRLFEQTQCAFSQIFGIYTDPERRVEENLRPRMGEPDWGFTDALGIRHRFWTVADPEAVTAVQEALRDRQIVIADGHHRYETSLAFRDEMRQRYPDVKPAPWDYVTMFLCNTVHRSLTILPAHRMLRRVDEQVLESFERRASEFFDLHCVVMKGRPGRRERGLRQLLEIMARRPEETVFGAYWGRSYAVALRLRDKARALDRYGQELSGVQRDVDVALLHSVVIRGLLGEKEDLARTSGRGNIYFERDPRACFDDVDEGRAAMALLCNPTRVEDVMRIAQAGERMPQKGTYFWPKPLAGVVLYDLRPEAPTLQGS